MTGPLLISYVFIWLLVVVQGFVLLEIVRQLGSIDKRIPTNRPLVVAEAAAIGDPLPQLRGVRATDRQRASWSDYLSNGLNVVVFATPRCSHCYSIAEDIGRYHDKLSRTAGITLVLEASYDDGDRFIRGAGLDPKSVILDRGGETARQIGINFYPAAMATSGGRLGQAAIVNSIEQIEAVIDQGVLDMQELSSALAHAPGPGAKQMPVGG